MRQEGNTDISNEMSEHCPCGPSCTCDGGCRCCAAGACQCSVGHECGEPACAACSG